MNDLIWNETAYIIDRTMLSLEPQCVVTPVGTLIVLFYQAITNNKTLFDEPR